MSLSEAKLRQLRIIDLKELLVKKGLPVSGKKEDLVARILAAEDKKAENTLKQTSNMDISNVINSDNTTAFNDKSNNGDADLFDKDLLISPNELTTGIDDIDWDKFTTDDIDALTKDSAFDSLISPTSPSLSVTSNKDYTIEKAKHNISKDGSLSAVKSEDSKKKADTKESSSKPDVLIKPSGFTCKKIVFDEPTASSDRNQPNLSYEIERRKKRAERFGTQLSDADKKLQRAARFGVEITSPIDSPLKAPLPLPSRKLSTSLTDDDEKLKKRAEKFGIDQTKTETQVKIATSPSSLSEEEKRRKRAEKFGLGNISSANDSSATNSTSISAGHSSLSVINEEEKKRRTERLDLNANGEPSKKKVKT